MDSHTPYIPGTCNMGTMEIKRRTTAGWIGLWLTVVTIGLLWYTDANKLWRLPVFIPVVMGATGFIQAYSKFCVYFGFGHIFNFGDVGKTDNVEQAENRAKDRVRAWQVLGLAVGVGLVVTSIIYLLPL